MGTNAENRKEEVGVQEGTKAKAEESVTMTKSEIQQLIQDEVARTLARQSQPSPVSINVSTDKIQDQLEEISAALGKVAQAEKKSSRSNKVAAFASVLLLIVFGAAVAILTPGLYTLLGNLNDTVTGLNATVEQVNAVVVSADETVQDLNAVIEDVGVQIDGSFEELNGAINEVSAELVDTIDNVNEQVSSIGTVIESVSDSVNEVNDVIEENADSITSIISSVEEFDYDGLNEIIANISTFTDDLLVVTQNLNTAVIAISDAADDVSGTANVATQTVDSLEVDLLNEVVAGLSEMIDELTGVASQLNSTAENLNETVSMISSGVDETMDSVDSIDFGDFNESIEALKKAAANLAETLEGLGEEAEE